ncbi:MAG: hypothetical protein ACYC3S_01915 [Chloroflexota bacterium]
MSKDNADPKALAAYGLLVTLPGLGGSATAEVWLRFVECRMIMH